VAIVFRSRVFSVEVVRKRFPNGAEHEITAVRHAPSVVIVPLAGNGSVVLIRQFRATVDKELWEFPAGSLNAGEDAAAAAKRECEEEIGLVPGRLERIGGLYPAPGFCDEELIFFIARDLTPPPPDSPHHPDEDEYIEKRTVSIDDARAMVGRGEIVDLKTAYGLTLI
jgi:ADP-ribose pyrophosphatase